MNQVANSSELKLFSRATITRICNIIIIITKTKKLGVVIPNCINSKKMVPESVAPILIRGSLNNTFLTPNIFYLSLGTRALNLALSASNDFMLIVLMARSTTCVDGLGLQSTSSPWASCDLATGVEYFLK